MASNYPVRRVASSGFGGRPGLNIISGLARGELQREQIERENERQAILNRVAESQMESMAQSRRIQAEDQEFEKAERLRREATATSAAAALKAMYSDKLGLDPSITENMSLDALNEVISGAKSMASMEASEAARQSSLSTIAVRNKQLEGERIGDAALELAQNPNFFHIAMFDDIDETTRLRAVEGAFPDTDPRVRQLAMEAVRKQALEIQEGARRQASPLGLDEGAKAPRNLIRSFADDAINRLGSLEAALDHANAKLEGMPEGEAKRVIEQIIADLEGRAEDAIDIDI
jgi:hypothetical protein